MGKIMNMKDKLPAINLLLQNPPADIGFSVQEIGEIIRAENLGIHLQTISEGFYLDKLLAALAWSLSLGHILTYAPGEEAAKWNESVIDGESLKINVKQLDVMRLHAIAFEARCIVDEVGPDPTGLELVKRFWELRQYILGLVQRDFPCADLGQLLDAA